MYRNSFFATILLGCLIFSCSGSYIPATNSFEQKYPIKRCPGRVPVIDVSPSVVVDQSIDAGRGIWLLEPLVDLEASLLRSREDTLYVLKMREQLEQRIKNKFIQDKWIVEPREEGLFQKPEDFVVDSTTLEYMKGRIRRQNMVDYSKWPAPSSLLSDDHNGYNLYIYISATIGYQDLIRSNDLYFFLIDNESKRVSYADFIQFNCDVRNVEGLNKVLEFAYLKLLEVRFTSEGTEAN